MTDVRFQTPEVKVSPPSICHLESDIRHQPGPTSPTSTEIKGAPPSFQVAQVGEALLDDGLLLGGVLELRAVRASEDRGGLVDASGVDAREAGEGPALDVCG